jgi:hypothetical protein
MGFIVLRDDKPHFQFNGKIPKLKNLKFGTNYKKGEIIYEYSNPLYRQLSTSSVFFKSDVTYKKTKCCS